MSEYFPEPKSLGANAKVELDLSNCATKSDFQYHQILTFGDTEIEKKNPLPPRYKSPIFLKDADIEKVLVSNKISRGDGQTKWMSFWVEDDDLLEKYNTIWDKVSADIKKEFDSEPVYNKNILKSKIKFHCDEVTDFYNKEIPKVDSNHTCLAVISLDSALNKDGNYYPQVSLK